MTSVGDTISAINSSWSFGGSVPEHFEQHIGKSVPFYSAGHDLILEISDFFVNQDSIVYDIGCSTGLLLSKLATHHSNSNAQFIGLDCESAMIDYSSSHYISDNISFFHADSCSFDFKPSDLIISFYTLQFIHPSVRQNLVDLIYNSLRWGGAFICFEKVRASDARFQDLANQLYIEHKLKSGYSSEEIISKSKSLKGILEPFSTQGNLDLFKRAGFVDCLSIFKYVCFEGFLCIK